MSTAADEKALTYEQERGKPLPTFIHGAVEVSLGVELAKHHAFRVAIELTWI